MAPETINPNFRIDWGIHAILRMICAHSFDSVLDIGSGEGEHKRFFEYFGKQVNSVDIVKSADFTGNFIEIDFDKRFDAIWCSHVLEHQRNVGLFLDKIYDVLADDGVLAIVVPIHPRERLISGHLTSWSVPLICYNLIMAGFDCSEAELLSTYELSLIVRKKPAIHSELRNPSAHGSDAGHEFDNIKQFFPFQAEQGITVKSGICTMNWNNPLEYTLPAPASGDRNISINSVNLDEYQNMRPRLIFS